MFFSKEPKFEKVEFDYSVVNCYDSLVLSNSVKESGVWKHPYIPGYTTIPIITKSVGRWGYMGPYELKTKEGYIFENFWQFSKVYNYTPKVDIVNYGRKVWSYPFTQFVDPKTKELTQGYFEWRSKGMTHNVPVRYPVYRWNASKCIYAISERELQNSRNCVDSSASRRKPKELDYIEARKDIYIQEYMKCLDSSKLYTELKTRYDQGEKFILSEVDGFHSKNAGYYKEKYPELKDEPLEFGMINATKRNISIKVNEPIDPSGHVYPIAMKLKGILDV